VITGGMAPITYTWNFSDTSTSVITSTSTITHNFPQTNTLQTYVVTLRAANACSSQVATPKPVTVRPFMVYLPVVMKPEF
jgi:hypothetical protein